LESLSELENKAIQIICSLCRQEYDPENEAAWEAKHGAIAALLLLFDWEQADVCDHCQACENPIATRKDKTSWRKYLTKESES